MKTKKLRFKSQENAEKRVRILERHLRELNDAYGKCIRDYSSQLQLGFEAQMKLAKLAADAPRFFNPLDAADAMELRDTILSRDVATGWTFNK